VIAMVFTLHFNRKERAPFLPFSFDFTVLVVVIFFHLLPNNLGRTIAACEAVPARKWWKKRMFSFILWWERQFRRWVNHLMTMSFKW